MTPLGRAVRRARTGRGWSQGKLALEVGVSQATVSYWERGVEYPRFEHVAALAGLFPTILTSIHQEELALVRRLMRAEREAFDGRCACASCRCA